MTLIPPLVSGTNTGSPRLCCGGVVGCSLGGTQTPTYGTSAHGPMGMALAAAGIEKAAALAIAASAGSITLRLVIAEPFRRPGAIQRTPLGFKGGQFAQAPFHSTRRRPSTDGTRPPRARSTSTPPDVV